jgi:hypothetical protein
MTNHRAQIETAIADGKAACDDLFQHLKGLKSADLADALPQAIGRLTHKQIATLLAPGQGQKMAKPERKEATAPNDEFFPIGEWGAKLQSLSPTVLASVAALTVMLMSTAFAINIEWAYEVISRSGIHRPMATHYWPPCPRLSVTIDGCVYRVQSSISLDKASLWLGMPADQILRTNPQIAANQAALPAYTPLVIWRGVGSLQQ